MFSIVYKTKKNQETIEERFTTAFSSNIDKVFKNAIEEVNTDGIDSVELSIIPLTLLDSVEDEEITLKKNSKMPDITMCSGEKCNLKETCYRFLATPTEHKQSYFSVPPIQKRKNSVSCGHYWEHPKKVGK